MAKSKLSPGRRDPRACPHCKRVFSNTSNANKHVKTKICQNTPYSAPRRHENNVHRDEKSSQLSAHPDVIPDTVDINRCAQCDIYYRSTYHAFDHALLNNCGRIPWVDPQSPSSTSSLNNPGQLISLVEEKDKLKDNSGNNSEDNSSEHEEDKPEKVKKYWKKCSNCDKKGCKKCEKYYAGELDSDELRESSDDDGY